MAEQGFSPRQSSCRVCVLHTYSSCPQYQQRASLVRIAISKPPSGRKGLYLDLSVVGSRIFSLNIYDAEHICVFLPHALVCGLCLDPICISSLPESISWTSGASLATSTWSQCWELYKLVYKCPPPSSLWAMVPQFPGGVELHGLQWCWPDHGPSMATFLSFLFCLLPHFLLKYPLHLPDKLLPPGSCLWVCFWGKKVSKGSEHPHLTKMAMTLLPTHGPCSHVCATFLGPDPVYILWGRISSAWIQNWKVDSLWWLLFCLEEGTLFMLIVNSVDWGSL